MGSAVHHLLLLGFVTLSLSLSFPEVVVVDFVLIIKLFLFQPTDLKIFTFPSDSLPHQRV